MATLLPRTWSFLAGLLGQLIAVTTLPCSSGSDTGVMRGKNKTWSKSEEEESVTKSIVQKKGAESEQGRKAKGSSKQKKIPVQESRNNFHITEQTGYLQLQGRKARHLSTIDSTFQTLKGQSRKA
ncbi:hypothetical protein DV515_00014529 [Chloebia gouldiae]|uniref:Uncharacterized protein n=1 Tax=Chloebia gouldiae TaxID=44316 RepID=A0A3L8RY30_CHLGU|nr:hypothetical protein DV515_00014529 [Chloebia gouldiae]